MRNEIAIEGNVVNNKFFDTKKGGKLLKMRIANDVPSPSGETKFTTYLDITAFDPVASQVFESGVNTGDLIAIENGRIANDSYTNKEGKKVNSLFIIANDLMVKRKKGVKSASSTSPSDRQKPTGVPDKTGPAAEDDIPF
jgi:single-stranded DNA-binding protein